MTMLMLILSWLFCVTENELPFKYIGYVDMAEADTIGQLFK